MTATVFKIIDIFFNEITGERVNPDGSKSNLDDLPKITTGDNLIFRFRVYENDIIPFDFQGSSELEFIVKELSTSDDTLLASLNADFSSAHWPSDDTYTVTSLTSITGAFAKNNLVTGQTSAATGRVFFFDSTHNRIYLRKVTGTFTAGEVIQESLPDGSNGAVGTTVTPVLEDFDRSQGRVACQFNSATLEFDNVISGHEKLEFTFELVEIFGDGSQRTIGSFKNFVHQDLRDSTGLPQSLIQLSLVLPGEVNTASHVGVGLRIFKQKAGVDFEFKGINLLATPNTPLILSDNPPGDPLDLDLDFDVSQIDHDTLDPLSLGINNHDDIDTHIADGLIHFTESSILHSNIGEAGSISHGLLDQFFGEAGRGNITGLELSFNSVSVIDIASGAARNSANGEDISSGSTISVDITAFGVDGLDTGSESSSTWYAIHLISSSTGPIATAAVFSLNATTPTFPAGYNINRRIGWVRNNSSSNFLRFDQLGTARKKFYFYDEDRAAQLNVLSGGSSTSFLDVALSNLVPPTIRRVNLLAEYNPNTAGNLAQLRTNGSSVTNPPYVISAESNPAFSQLEIVSDSSQKIEFKVANASDSLNLFVIGWIDYL